MKSPKAAYFLAPEAISVKEPSHITELLEGWNHGRRHCHRSPACAAQAHNHAQEGHVNGKLPPAAARDFDAALLRSDARPRT